MTCWPQVWKIYDIYLCVDLETNLSWSARVGVHTVVLCSRRCRISWWDMNLLVHPKAPIHITDLRKKIWFWWKQWLPMQKLGSFWTSQVHEPIDYSRDKAHEQAAPTSIWRLPASICRSHFTIYLFIAGLFYVINIYLQCGLTYMMVYILLLCFGVFVFFIITEYSMSLTPLSPLSNRRGWRLLIYHSLSVAQYFA